MALGALSTNTMTSGLGNIQAGMGTPNAPSSNTPMGGLGMGAVQPGQPLAPMNGAPAPSPNQNIQMIQGQNAGQNFIGATALNMNQAQGQRNGMGATALNMNQAQTSPWISDAGASQLGGFGAFQAPHPQVTQALKTLPPGMLQSLHNSGMIHPQLMQHVTGNQR
jgi:hypothetical protein